MLSLFSVTVFVFAKEENYYELLGISKDANVKDIRRAFKNLAVKLHPDKNKVCHLNITLKLTIFVYKTNLISEW